MLVTTRMYRSVASALAAYGVTSALRLDSARSTNLGRTAPAGGNGKTFIWSGWVKRNKLGTQQELFMTNTYPNYAGCAFTPTDGLMWWLSSSSTMYSCTTTSVFRDVSKPYHVIFAVDTTQAGNNAMLIVDGVLQTVTMTVGANGTYPPQGTQTNLASTYPVNMGYWAYNNTAYADITLSEVNIIDGYPTGLNASNWTSASIAALFGYAAAFTSQWLPRQYKGVYGVQGCYLPFKNNTSLTTLGWDQSDANPSTVVTSNLTVTGAPTISTTQSKFGSGALSLNGSSYLTTGCQSTAFGTSDFTVEAFAYFNNLTAASNVLICRQNASADEFALGVTSGGQVLVDINNATVLLSPTSTIVTGQFYHIAVSRAAGTMRIFVNGVQVASAANSTSVASTLTNETIGFMQWQSRYMNGYINDLRVYKGVGKYTSNFTAPTAIQSIDGTDPYWQYCTFAAPFVGANASTTFTQFCAVPSVGANPRYFPTNAGSVVLSDTQRKFGNMSAYFSGTGTNLLLSSPGSAFGTGDFTVELFVYPTTAGGDTGVLDARTSADSNGWLLEIFSNKMQVRSTASGGYRASTTSFVANTWYHVAFVRQAGTSKLYINGVAEATWTDSTNYATNGTMWLGALYNNTFNFAGYVDELRVTKGVARYTSNFTVPNTPMVLGSSDPYWNNVALAMPMNGVVNSTNIPVYSPNNWTLNNCTLSGVNAAQTLDSPSNVYPTFNPLSKASNVTVSNGALVATFPGSGSWAVATTVTIPATGKWAFKATYVSGTAGPSIGLCNESTISTIYPETLASSIWYYGVSGAKYLNGTASGSYGLWAVGQSVEVLIDRTADTIEFRLNGTTLFTQTGIPAGATMPAVSNGFGDVVSIDFGQMGYVPPAGFQTLCTSNL